MSQLAYVFFATLGLFASGAQFQAEQTARLVRKEAGERQVSAQDDAGANFTLPENGTTIWCNSELDQQGLMLKQLTTLSSFKAETVEVLSVVIDVVRALRLDNSTSTAFLLAEYARLNIDDYLCDPKDRNDKQTVNQAAVLAVPGILRRACNNVNTTAGTLVLSDEHRNSLLTLVTKAASSIACSENKKDGEKKIKDAREETARRASTSKNVILLEDGREALHGMASDLAFVLEEEHRLDLVDAMVPGAKAALRAQFGSRGGATLLALDGAALEAGMQRVAKQMREVLGTLGISKFFKIHQQNVRPHPYRPGGEGFQRRALYAAKVCPGSSNSTLNGLYKTRKKFDQGCTSSIPIKYLKIMTPACYGHDMCCECGTSRSDCDAPFSVAMKAECDRKFEGFSLESATCKAYASAMSTASHLWGLITGTVDEFPEHCSDPCAKDMLAYKHMLDLDPYFL